MDEDQKKYFRTLCSTGTITHAAEALFISRQGLSKSMKNLEKQLGTQLFVRNKRGIELTDTGHMLLRYIREEEKLWTTCLADIRSVNAVSPELIRIGLQIMYFGYEQKHSILSIFQDDPSIRIEVVDGDHDDFWRAIAKGDMEFAFTIGLPADMELPAIKLVDDTLSVLLSVDDPLAQAPSVNFETDLTGKTVLQTSPYKGRLYAAAFKNYGIKSEHLAPDKDLMLAHVATDKKCFIIQTQYAKDLVTEQVCMRPLINAPIQMDATFVFRSDLSAAAQAVARTLVETFNKEKEFDVFFPAVPYESLT